MQEIKQTGGPVFQIVIQFQPSTGMFQVSWPQIDPMSKMGMLEGARASLYAEVIGQINAAASPIVVPKMGVKLPS